MNLRPLYQTASAVEAMYRILYLAVLAVMLLQGKQLVSPPPHKDRRK